MKPSPIQELLKFDEHLSKSLGVKERDARVLEQFRALYRGWRADPAGEIISSDEEWALDPHDPILAGAFERYAWALDDMEGTPEELAALCEARSGLEILVRAVDADSYPKLTLQRAELDEAIEDRFLRSVPEDVRAARLKDAPPGHGWWALVPAANA